MEERKIKESEYFDQRERDKQKLDKEAFESKYSSEKFYTVIRLSHAYSDDWMRNNCKDKVVLDYCCGRGGASLVIAQHGGIVHGIDISEESVKAAEANLTAAGFKNRAFFKMMDAEKLEFPDNFFDAIVCIGVLHHLDLDYASPELARVLKPTGSLLAIEALGYNPIFQLYRRFTPSLRTAYEAEHILTLKEVGKLRKLFGKVNIRYFHFFSLLAVPFRKTPLFEPILSLFEMLDKVILRIPFLQLMAWQMIFELKEPRKK